VALVNLSLLFGAGAIAIPIVLHLLLRQQPKRMVFPAIRFLQERQESNRSRLKLRHWLLLALRCLGVLTIAGALARPSVATTALGNWLLVPLAGILLVVVALVTALAWSRRMERLWVWGGTIATLLLALLTGGLVVRALGHGTPRMLGDQEAPVAALLVFDTAPRMEYRFENRTRLEAARDLANWVVQQLPEGSDLAVVDARPNAPVFSLDRSAATKAIERLELTGVSQPLPDVLSASRGWLEASQHARKEIYLFTDVSRGGWGVGKKRSANQDEGQEADDATKPKSKERTTTPRIVVPDGIDLYVIDVGVEQPKNAGLGELRLSNQTLPPSGELEIRADVASVGLQGTRVVEVLVDQPDPNLPVIRDGEVQWPVQAPRGRQEIELSSTSAKSIEFRLAGLPTGTVQGEVRLLGEDGLAVDDRRYFTVQVQESTPLLVVSPEGGVAKFFIEAVAPREFRQTGRAEFACTEVAVSALGQQPLESFGAVCLLDPPPLPAEDWAKLLKFVESGGGLAVFLGHNAQAGGTFHDPIAERLLGGRLHRRWRAPTGDVYLAPDQFEHPVTREFREVATSVPWDQFPVYRHWELEPVAETTRTIVRYGNGKPAILETAIGRGRVLVMTTPVSDSARPRGRDAWNELPTAPDAWPFVVLADQMTQYLAGTRASQLNFFAGQLASWVGHPEREPERYQLFLPAGVTQDVATRDGRGMVKFTEQPGQYRLRGFRDGPQRRGFSVNIPESATDLSRLDPGELDAWLGKGAYQLARDQQGIRRGIGEARVGREFFPFLVLMLVAVLAVEQLLANRFYGSKS